MSEEQQNKLVFCQDDDTGDYFGFSEIYEEDPEAPALLVREDYHLNDED